MTLGYVFTAGRRIYKLAHAIPFRSDTRWLVVVAAGICCLLLLVVLLATQFKFRKVPILRLCSIGLGVLSVVVIVLRQQVLSALIVIWVVLIGYLWAAWVFRRMGATRGTDNAEWVAIGCATGLALLSLLPLTLGLTGVLTFRWILISLVVATLLQITGLKEVILGARRFIASHRRLPDAGDPENTALECLITAIFFFNLCEALSPELSFDALNYQLAVPRFYLESHSIIDLPYFWHSYFARLVNSLYLFCLALGGPITCKLLMLTTGLITTLGVWAFTREMVNRTAALWAVAIFYSTPLVGLLSTVAYVDLTLGMFVITTWLAFLRWQRSGEMAWLLASAVLTGACVGTKPNGAYALPVLGVALVWRVLRERPLYRGMVRLLLFGLVALVIALPWYLMPWYWTGNPVFPLLNGVFKSPFWEPLNSWMNAGDFGLGISLKSFIQLPFFLTFASHRFDESLPAGGLGIALMFFPVGLWLVLKQRKFWLPLAATAMFCVLWFRTFQYARYYVPILPILVPLAIGGVVEWTRQEWTRGWGVAVLWVTLVAQCVLLPPPFRDMAVRNPAQLIFHQRSDVEFLRRAIPPYSAVEYLNGVTAPGDLVVGEGVDWIRYYLKAPLITLVESTKLQEEIRRADEKELAARFSRAGYHYLMVNRPMVRRVWPHIKPSFLEKFATLEYSLNSVEVYRLHEHQVDGRAAPVEK